jgi:hypothetical protein
MRIKTRVETSPDGLTFSIGRQGHDRNRSALIGPERPNFADHTEAILPGHRQIAEHDVGMVAGESGKAFRCAAGRVNPSPKGLQHRRQCLSPVLLIVDDQHSKPVQFVRLFSVSGRALMIGSTCDNLPRRVGACARQRDGEDGALSFTRTVRGHRSSVHFDQIPHDRQAQTKAAEGPLRRGVFLAEAFEDGTARIRPGSPCPCPAPEFQAARDPSAASTAT